MVSRFRFVPGTYARRVPNGRELAARAIREWELRHARAPKENVLRAGVNNCIAFSRKIGVGALEIADLVAEKLGMKVADREVLDHIARSHDLGEQTIGHFDERYPGVMNELSALLFGEKSFIMEDYHRYLVSAVFSLAETAPTVFVGRVSHLILPRDKVLAVRFIASREFRAKRISEVLQVDQSAAGAEIDAADMEQREFFRKIFGKTDAPAYEFDLVINRDFLTSPALAADLVATAYRGKFGAPA